MSAGAGAGAGADASDSNAQGLVDAYRRLVCTFCIVIGECTYELGGV